MLLKREMTKYIIFLDGEMKGYINDPNVAKQAISKLADDLINKMKDSCSNPQMLRILRENVDSGIHIYTQELGTYFNGSVTLRHTITWQMLPEY